MTIWRVRIACWKSKAIHTLIIRSSYWFSTATMVAQKRLNITCQYIICLANYKRIFKTQEEIVFLLATVDMCSRHFETTITVISHVILLRLCPPYFLLYPRVLRNYWYTRKIIKLFHIWNRLSHFWQFLIIKKNWPQITSSYSYKSNSKNCPVGFGIWVEGANRSLSED